MTFRLSRTNASQEICFRMLFRSDRRGPCTSPAPIPHCSYPLVVENKCQCNKLCGLVCDEIYCCHTIHCIRLRGRLPRPVLDVSVSLLFDLEECAECHRESDALPKQMSHSSYSSSRVVDSSIIDVPAPESVRRVTMCLRKRFAVPHGRGGLAGAVEALARHGHA